MPCQCSLACGNAGAQGPGKILVRTKRCGKKVGEDELDKSNEKDRKGDNNIDNPTSFVRFFFQRPRSLTVL